MKKSILLTLLTVCFNVILLGSNNIKMNTNIPKNGSASISGKVLNISGEELQGISVCLINIDDEPAPYCTVTDSYGNYSFENIVPDRYFVSFYPQGESVYLPEFYNNNEPYTGEKLEINDGDNIVLDNVILEKEAVIQGKILNNNNEPIEYVSVYAQHSEDIFYSNGDTSDKFGNFKIKQLKPGSYILEFRTGSYTEASQYLPEFYNNKQTEESADKIVVSNGDIITTENVYLDLGSSINGKIIDNNKNGIENVHVILLDSEHNWSMNGAYSDTFGNYQINGIKSGSYKIYFSKDYDNVFLPEYYDNKLTFENANIISVNENETINSINATLTMSSSIKGFVKNENGNPAPDTYISVYDEQENYIDCEININENGFYTINGLRSGLYKLYFESTEYISVFYGNEYFFENAEAINVGDNQVIELDTVFLKTGGSIIGTFTNLKEGYPFSGRAYIYNENNKLVKWGYFSGNSFEVKGIPGGKFKLLLDPGIESSYYTQRYYNNKDNIDNADLIEVQTGKTTELNDIYLEVKGAISGKVADEFGNPLDSIVINLYNKENKLINSETTDNSGNYIFHYLPKGFYKVEFNTNYYVNYYLSEFYNSSLTIEEAHLVEVKSGENTENINAKLKINPLNENSITINIPHIANTDGWETNLVFDNSLNHGSLYTLLIYNNINNEPIEIISNYIYKNQREVIKLDKGTCGIILLNKDDNINVKEVFYNTIDKGIAEFQLNNLKNHNLFYTFPKYEAYKLTWMGLALMNLDDEVSNTTLKVYTDSGKLLETKEISLNPKSKIASTLENLFPNIYWRNIAKIEAESSTNISGINISGFKNERLLFTNALPTKTLDTLYIPHIAEEINDWENKLIFDNSNADIKNAIIKFYKNSDLVYTKEIEIKGFQTVTYNINQLNSILGFMPDCGIIEINTDNISVRESFIHKRERGIAEFKLNNSVTSQLIYNFPTYKIEDLTWMGLSIMNTSDKEQTLTLKAYKNGFIVGEKAINIDSKNRTVGLIKNFFDKLTYTQVDRIEVIGTEGLCGLNISGSNWKRLLFSQADNLITNEQ